MSRIKLQRRGFLGFLAGAATAGPAALKNEVAKLPSGIGMDMPYAFFPMSGETPEPHHRGNTKLTRISALRNFLAGRLTEREREEITHMQLEARREMVSQNIAQLVSVSAVSKVRIFQREMIAHAIELERSRKRSYLAELLQED